MDQKRKEIRRIQRDSTLSSQEKVERIQRLMNPLEDRISQKSNENNECNHYKKNVLNFIFHVVEFMIQVTMSFKEIIVKTQRLKQSNV